MKNSRTPTKSELNYALRRVLYNVLIATKALIEFQNTSRDFSKKESYKITAMIMARNLNEFLFNSSYRYDDDIHVIDFNINSWSPDNNAELTTDSRTLSKIVGHVVAKKTNPLSNPDIPKMVRLLIKESCEFIDKAIANRAAKYTGASHAYLKRLNSLLPLLPIKINPIREK
jgi:hypothetical protein